MLSLVPGPPGCHHKGFADPGRMGVQRTLSSLEGGHRQFPQTSTQGSPPTVSPGTSQISALSEGVINRPPSAPRNPSAGTTSRHFPHPCCLLPTSSASGRISVFSASGLKRFPSAPAPPRPACARTLQHAMWVLGTLGTSGNRSVEGSGPRPCLAAEPAAARRRGAPERTTARHQQREGALSPQSSASPRPCRGTR